MRCGRNDTVPHCAGAARRNFLIVFPPQSLLLFLGSALPVLATGHRRQSRHARRRAADSVMVVVAAAVAEGNGIDYEAEQMQYCCCAELLRAQPKAGEVRDLTTWTILQNDDPNHLGMRCNALPGHKMAPITSGCVPSGAGFLPGAGERREGQARSPRLVPRPDGRRHRATCAQQARETANPADPTSPGL